MPCPEILIARLTIGSAPLEQVGSAFDGLKAADIAHALGGLRHGPYEAGLYAWSDGSRTELLDAMLRAIWSKDNWNDIDIRLRRAMCQLSIQEVVGPNICPQCGGRHLSGGDKTEWWPPGANSPIECKPCGGTGIYRLSRDDQADALGISLTEWKLHQKHYYEVHHMLCHWLSAARTHVYIRVGVDTG